MTISKQDAAHVAKLARLELDKDQMDLFTKQLNTVLEYVEVLRQVDTRQVEPITHAAHFSNVFREDHVQPSLSREESLENAPEKIGGFFKVPRVI